MSASLVRAGYWLAFQTIGQIGLRIALARSTLVLYDRHFVDVLVDPARYRYGGPMWLMRLVWRLIPRPDLILLLDAPAEVLQARKQEVPFAVTARQRNAYAALVRTLPNGRFVNAAQPFEAVANDAIDMILDNVAARTNRRFVEHPGSRSAAKELPEGQCMLDVTSVREQAHARAETKAANPAQTGSTLTERLAPAHAPDVSNRLW
jgi:hypothetical protein